LIEVFVKGFLKQEDNEVEKSVRRKTNETVENSERVLSEEMRACLKAYSSNYHNFLVVSVLDDPAFNREFKDFCHAEGIDFSVYPLTKREYRIKGGGHLNRTGNYLLGKHLYSFVIRSNTIHK